MLPRQHSATPTPLRDNIDPIRRFVIAAAVLTLGFSLSLYDLVRFALGSELFSHVILIPFISAYLIWQRRHELPKRFTADPVIATIPLFLGAMALGGYGLAVATGIKLAHDDRLALTTSAYLLLLIGAGGWCFGRELLRAVAFPLAFLVFAIPMPAFLTDAIEIALQHGSAEVVAVFFNAAGTPNFRQGLIFQLPGITIQVAQECSGIHSTVALFITSIIGGYFFLRRPANRVLFTLAVIPLALLRNGFRVFVIGELCVHVSPDMIHSYIHHQGGPIFFALSLIPFGILLVLLRRWEQSRERATGDRQEPPSMTAV